MSTASRRPRKASGGLSVSDKRNYPPRVVEGNCPVCQKPLGLGGIDCVPAMKNRWFHHECQMEMIMPTPTAATPATPATTDVSTTQTLNLQSLDRASMAAGKFLEKSGITDMQLMSYEDWRAFIETICKAYVELEGDEIPF